jgi:uncharacterized protein YozE (UPF0346 family)
MKRINANVLKVPYDNNIPVLFGRYDKEGDQWRGFCPWCEKEHSHGKRDGLRGSHCGSRRIGGLNFKESPFREHGYIIRTLPFDKYKTFLKENYQATLSKDGEINFRKKRKSKSSKIKSFLEYLEHQIDRDDPIGDFARDSFDDLNATEELETFDQWLEYLESVSACKEAITALERAWDEYVDVRSPIYPNDGTSLVYFIHSPQTNMVKIGTTRNLDARLRSIRTSSATQIEILHTLEGNCKIEKSIHRKYTRHKSHGEWFHLDGELLDFLSDYID